MGNSSSLKYVNFEEVQQAQNNNETIIINTLPILGQQCLICGSILGGEEEAKINELLATNKRVKIIVYGLNCSDVGVIKKATQLKTLGFDTVCVYGGGLFEWLLLQDVYGSVEFKTTNVGKDKRIELLKYK